MLERPPFARLSHGAERVGGADVHDRRYDVWLAPGETFEGVRLEWQGPDGKWHAH